MSAVIDYDRLTRDSFHSTTAYRAAMYATRQINQLLILSARGMKFFDNWGEFVPEIKVQYEEGIVVVKDGEGAWVVRVGDTRHERTGKVMLTKLQVNEWLKTIRYVNPVEYKRLRLH